MSIRDQMFRGYIIIKRAIVTGLLVPGQESPILVVGAGVAGVMATLVALEHGIKVWLVESELPLDRQLKSGRVLCPTQYDWPAPHWSQGQYPWTGPAMPANWTKSSASAVALRWRSLINLAVSTYHPLLVLKVRTKFSGCDIVDDQVQARFDPEISEAPRFSLVVACAGFGSERTAVPKRNPSYTGFKFWEQDLYAKPNLGLKEQKPRVLISGAGDGALQDFLRITTKMPACDIYATLPNDIKFDVERRIAKIEDYATRSFLWGDVGILDHPIHQDVHDEYEEVVQELFAGKFSGKIRKSLKSIVCDPEELSVRIVFPCDHFSSCYALNRFLVLLISSYLRNEFGVAVLGPRVKVLDVRSLDTDHTCLNRPNFCHGFPHDVIARAATCEDFKSTDESDPEERLVGGPFNVLIIRHGIKPAAPPLGSWPSATPYRQAVPYYSPW